MPTIQCTHILRIVYLLIIILEETNPPGMTQLNSGGSRQDVDGDQTDDDNRNPRLLGNGDINKPLELSVRDSSSEHYAGRVCVYSGILNNWLLGVVSSLIMCRQLSL